MPFPWLQCPFAPTKSSNNYSVWRRVLIQSEGDTTVTMPHTHVLFISTFFAHFSLDKLHLSHFLKVMHIFRNISSSCFRYQCANIHPNGVHIGRVDVHMGSDHVFKHRLLPTVARSGLCASKGAVQRVHPGGVHQVSHLLKVDQRGDVQWVADDRVNRVHLGQFPQQCLLNGHHLLLLTVQ